MAVGRHRGELVERDAELAAIVAAVERAAGGAGGVLLVEGVAGVGTCLLEALVESAQTRPLLVLRARGGGLRSRSR